MTIVRGLTRASLGLVAVAGLSLVAVPAASATPPPNLHCSATKGTHTGTKVEAESAPAKVKVYDSRTGKDVEVVVKISGPELEIKSADYSLELTDATWCVKAGTSTYYGSGTSGNSHIYNKNGKLKDISYVLLYWVTSKEKCPPK